MNGEIGHLVLTLRSNRDAIRIDAFDEYGNAIEVYVEVADLGSTHRHRIRVVAPRNVSVNRLAHEDIPA